MIVVTGGSGQLGTAFRRLRPDALFPSRNELDLADEQSVVAALDRFSPALVVNCGAFTAVDLAEREIGLARAVNATAVGAIATWCAGNDAGFVTFSTDYVFDGTKQGPYVESDDTGPRSVYGSTKLEGEQLALAAHPRALIVRTSWVISGTHPNFVATMLALTAHGEGVRVVDDQRGCPTIVDDLAPAVLAAIDAGAAGVLHLANSGSTTWFGLARAAVELAGRDPELVQPTTTAEFPRPAPRPANSVLASERLAGLGLQPLPPWRRSLGTVVQDLTASL